jgi:hypothetical protein
MRKRTFVMVLIGAAILAAVAIAVSGDGDGFARIISSLPGH